jgi:hypothetical protein
VGKKRERSIPPSPVADILKGDGERKLSPLSAQARDGLSQLTSLISSDADRASSAGDTAPAVFRPTFGSIPLGTSAKAGEAGNGKGGGRAVVETGQARLGGVRSKGRLGDLLARWKNSLGSRVSIDGRRPASHEGLSDPLVASERLPLFGRGLTLRKKSKVAAAVSAGVSSLRSAPMMGGWILLAVLLALRFFLKRRKRETASQ